MATRYVNKLIELCSKAGIEVPTNIRTDQNLTIYLLNAVLTKFQEWVNVEDATAKVAADVASGKVAYGYNDADEPVKITGSVNTISTAELAAAAVAADIIKDKVAFVNGTKLTGTKVLAHAAPTNLAFTEKALAWDAVVGATNYYIYKSDTEGVAGTLLATVQTNAYDASAIVTAGTYYFTVAASDLGVTLLDSARSAECPLVVSE